MADGLQQFQWTGIDRHGKRVTGDIQATDTVEAQVELKKREIEIVSLKQVKKRFSFSFGSKKVKNQDILLFTRYLSTMMSAGLPILQALDVLARDQENVKMQAFIITLKNNISGGKTLAESFNEFPQYFGQLYISLIRTGEKSGTLDKILKRLATYLEKTENLKRKIKKAMIYPAAIISVALIVSCILLIFVVPRFQTIFSSFGAKLPLFTRIIVALSDYLRSYWWLLILLIIGGIALFRYKVRTSEAFREKLDRIALKLYILGNVLQKAIIARYARTLAITLEAGMPIVDAMKSMSEIMGNAVYAKAVLDISREVVHGNQMYVAMSATNLFPNMVVQMVSIGEASGSLGEMLNKIADYYEDEVNNIVDSLSSLLEPLIMAILGVIVGSFVVAMYLPIFKLGSLF